MEQAANNLHEESRDVPKYTDERSREMLRRASHLVANLKRALEGGRSYAGTVTGAAQKFDYILGREG